MHLLLSGEEEEKCGGSESDWGMRASREAMKLCVKPLEQNKYIR